MSGRAPSSSNGQKEPTTRLPPGVDSFSFYRGEDLQGAVNLVLPFALVDEMMKQLAKAKYDEVAEQNSSEAADIVRRSVAAAVLCKEDLKGFTLLVWGMNLGVWLPTKLGKREAFKSTLEELGQITRDVEVLDEVCNAANRPQSLVKLVLGLRDSSVTTLPEIRGRLEELRSVASQTAAKIKQILNRITASSDKTGPTGLVLFDTLTRRLYHRYRQAGGEKSFTHHGDQDDEGRARISGEPVDFILKVWEAVRAELPPEAISWPNDPRKRISRVIGDYNRTNDHSRDEMDIMKAVRSSFSSRKSRRTNA